MILSFLDWMGTILIIFAAFLFTSKKAFSPKIRRIAIISYIISNGFWIPMAILLGAYGMLVSQIILLCINLKGIYYIKKELRGNGKNQRKKNL